MTFLGSWGLEWDYPFPKPRHGSSKLAEACVKNKSVGEQQLMFYILCDFHTHSRQLEHQSQHKLINLRYLVHVMRPGFEHDEPGINRGLAEHYAEEMGRGARSSNSILSYSFLQFLHLLSCLHSGPSGLHCEIQAGHCSGISEPSWFTAEHRKKCNTRCHHNAFKVWVGHECAQRALGV